MRLCTTPGSRSYDTHGCRVFRGEATTWLARVLQLGEIGNRILGAT